MAAGTLQLTKGAPHSELKFKMPHGAYALEGKVAPIVKQLLKYTFKAERGSATDIDESTTLENNTVPTDTNQPEQAPKERGIPTQESKPQISNAVITKTLKGIKSLALQIRKEVAPSIKQKTFSAAEDVLL